MIIGWKNLFLEKINVHENQLNHHRFTIFYLSTGFV